MISPQPATPARPLDTLPFFVAAWALAAVSMGPVALAQLGVIAGPAERYMALAPIAVFSPMLAAMLVSRLERGGEGIGSVFRPLRDWRAPPVWYAVAIVVSPFAFVAGVAVYKLAGGSGDVQWWYPPHTPDRIAAMFLIPIGEEIGWRGFALPRMLKRYGPLKAAVLMGFGWGLWHVPLFLAQGVGPGGLLIAMVLFLVPGSIVYTWVFQRARGLLPVAIAMHVGIHSNNSMLPLPGNQLPFFIHFAAMTVLAGVLLLADRKSWAAVEVRQ